MKTLYEIIREFHEAFGLHIEDEPINDLGDTERALRWRLLDEELDELKKAEEDKDVIEIADALGDIIYIVAGTALCYGINIDEVLSEIHRSNMTKLDSNGKPIYRDDGKVLKSTFYEKPNIKKVLEKM